MSNAEPGLQTLARKEARMAVKTGFALHVLTGTSVHSGTLDWLLRNANVVKNCVGFALDHVNGCDFLAWQSNKSAKTPAPWNAAPHATLGPTRSEDERLIGGDEREGEPAGAVRRVPRAPAVLRACRRGAH